MWGVSRPGSGDGQVELITHAVHIRLPGHEKHALIVLVHSVWLVDMTDDLLSQAWLTTRPAAQQGTEGADLRRLVHPIHINQAPATSGHLTSTFTPGRLVRYTNLVSRMASSLAWLADYAERLLRQAEPACSPSPIDPPTSDQPHPLAVLLLWLDCLSFLANCTPQPTPASAEPLPVDQAEASGVEHDRPGSRSGRGQGSLSSHSDSIDEFVAYLDQVVSPLRHASFSRVYALCFFLHDAPRALGRGKGGV